MNREYFVVGYDIADAKRLAQVAKIMIGFGERLQFSIFLCHLDRMELATLRSRLTAIVNHARDSIFILRIGNTDIVHKFQFVGRHAELPSIRSHIF